MKISDVMKITKPTYKYIKIVPNNSVRNNSTYKVARAISSLYKNIFQRIETEEKKLIKLLGKEYLIGTKFNFNTFEKVSYFIYMEKKKVEFYFIIPEQHMVVITDKLIDSWYGITIEEVDKLPEFLDNSVKCQLQYIKEDALSLNVDRRSNELLNSNLKVIESIEEGERVGIFYNFIPTTQRTWRATHKNTITKLSNNEPVDRDKGRSSYILKYALSILTTIVNDIFGALSGKEEKENFIEYILNKFNKGKKISDTTIRKENDIILETQILIMSESKNKIRQMNNVRAVAQSFETISEDNRLISKPYKMKVNYLSKDLKAAKNKMSDMEIQNFICLAGRDILEEYDFIDKINTKETTVPEELQKGHISIGINTYKGNTQEAFLTTDKEYKNLTLMLIGPTRAGKSTLIQNMAYDAIKNNECVVIFDFIKNCELSEEVAEAIEKDKITRIECNDFSKMQGLGYNEVGYDKDPFKQYDNTKKQTTQLMTLVNSINAGDLSLSAKMEKHLTSASLIAFISGGSIKDVFDILQNHNIRHKFLNKVPEIQYENLQEYMDDLRTLDDYDKNGEIIVGTKLNLVTGIIDRLNKLKANTYMELMLKKGTENNLDLSKEIQKPGLICIKMPEDMFSTDGERDVYTTYWITKLWLALQMRARNIPDRSKHTKVNLIIDEIYQVNNTEKFLTEKLSRLAKFTVKPIISCHYINQLKYMRQELRSANASYMLISGCDKHNYNEFKEELEPYGVEDLLKLPRFHSLNLVKHSNGYGKFITKLPPPVKSAKINVKSA